MKKKRAQRVLKDLLTLWIGAVAGWALWTLMEIIQRITR